MSASGPSLCLTILLLGLATLAFGASSARAASPIVVSEYVGCCSGSVLSGSSFSPNGDNNEDSTYQEYTLSRVGNVDVDVVDALGLPVREIQTGVSEQAGTVQTWSWDGKDDLGVVVADGSYTILVTATDSDGGTSSISTKRVVDTRLPGRLVAPTPGSKLSGTVVARFVPSSGFVVDSVSVTCVGALAVQPDGSWSGSADSSNCGDGAQIWSASVAFSDAVGMRHSWQSPDVGVTIGNPVVVSEYAPCCGQWPLSGSSFSPNGDNNEDSTYQDYTLSRPASVDVVVTNALGVVVRRLATADPESPPTAGWSWDGKDDLGVVVADGSYTILVTATDSDGGTSSISTKRVVDTRVPGLLSAPTAGTTVAGLVRLAFTPNPSFDLISQVTWCFSTGGCAAAYGPSVGGDWRTTIAAGTLTKGPADVSMTVYFTDTVGANHFWQSAPEAVTIDTTSIPLAASLTPSSGVAPLATALSFDSSDPNGLPLAYRVNFGDGTDPVTGTVSPPYPTTQLAHTYADAGSFNATITVSNGQGGAAVKVVNAQVSARANNAPTASLQLADSSGVAPFDASATIAGADIDSDPLTYRLNWGDGSTVATGSLPADVQTHRYSTPGSHLIRLEVSDGRLDAVKTATITVGLSEPLKAIAGDSQAAAPGQPVNFDGSASRPAAAISAYDWDFGDGSTGTGATTTHTYASAGTYVAKLTVHAGTNTDTSTATIVVRAEPPQAGLAVLVRDSSGQPISGADVLVIDASGTRYPTTTDADGRGRIVGLADGSYTAYGWKDGYVPATASAGVVDSSGSLTMT
ncbi:MAG TPA: PKD domain-containing protein, partial [Microbacteriaceae bacterium]|nr:PKD domain-containing protein [Microbacteriaceae bacterium]